MITIVECGWLLQITWELIYYSKPHSYVTLSPIQANRGCFFLFISELYERMCSNFKFETSNFEF